MMRFAKKRRRPIASLEISLTPLIDTALTLLVIFMVTAPMVHYGIKVDLPKAQSKEANIRQDLVIAINEDENLYFNNTPIAYDALGYELKNFFKHFDEASVHVRAAKKVSCGKVISVVDQLKQAGVRYVALSTQPIS